MLQKLLDIEDNNMYLDDYLLKKKGISTFSDIEKANHQFELTDFLEYFKRNNLIKYIENEIENIKVEHIYKSHTHGINHNIKVMIYSLYLAHTLRLPSNDIDLLMNASKYHDTGRINDKEDDKHGLRSAEKTNEILGSSYTDINMLKAIMELHSIDDKKYAHNIAEKYNITDFNRFVTLYSVLKDADALDRIRLKYYNAYETGLDPSMLRLKQSRSLVKIAHQVNECFVKNTEKPNIILDTDIENEIDDKFALTYLLQSLHMFNLDAITIAPFYGSKYSTIKDNNIDNIGEGIDASYNTAIKIINLLNPSYKDKVFKGSTGVISNGYNGNSEAVEKIIEICNKNNKTQILCISALTNVAMAIKKDPSIVNKASVVWLGGNDFMYDKNDEFNFRQDISAVREVFSSGIDLTLIPCVNVGSILVTTEPELKSEISDVGEIGKYLYDEFCRCKPEETGKSKTIWDLSVIGYLVNPEWFEMRNVDAPGIGENGKYIFGNSSNSQMTVVTRIARDKVFKDFFQKVRMLELEKTTKDNEEKFL